jgi:hypothetical protein
VKRDRLLSDVEHKRLEERQALDRHTRTINDMRVKKKLASWLKSADDVLHILENLPADQIREVSHDRDIYILLHIAEDLMQKRGFYPLEGDVENPDRWQIVIDENTRRPARNLDVIRSWWAYLYANELQSISGRTNLIGKVTDLGNIDEQYPDRVTDGEKKAIRRLEEAREQFFHNDNKLLEVPTS